MGRLLLQYRTESRLDGDVRKTRRMLNRIDDPGAPPSIVDRIRENGCPQFPTTVEDATIDGAHIVIVDGHTPVDENILLASIQIQIQ
jgi:hypothetical protein